MSSTLDLLREQYRELGDTIAKVEREQGYRLGCDFVPGWKIVEGTSHNEGSTLVQTFVIEKRTPEVVFPKSRYDWKAIIKRYPDAKWVSTDYSGRIDLWTEEPKIGSSNLVWIEPSRGSLGCITIGRGRYNNVGITKDWKQSKEYRPDFI